MRKPVKKLHHISPVPDGFLVRVTRGGVVAQVFIAKGVRHALRHARAARDELLAGAPDGDYEYAGERPYLISHPVARSNTGFVGLSHTWNKRRKDYYEVIKAAVQVVCGRTQSRTFSVNAYGGYEQALKAGYEWREGVLKARRARHRER